MKKLLSLTQRYLKKQNLLGLVLISIFCVAKDLGGVITLATATDHIIAGEGVLEALLAMGLVMLAGVGIVALDRTIKGRITLNLRQQLLSDFEAKLHRIRMEELDNMEAGQLLSEYTGDIQKLSNWFERTLPQVIQLCFYLIGALAYCLNRSVSLTFSVFPAVAIAIPVLLHIAKKLDTSVKKERAVADKAVHHVGELLTGLEFIKTYQLEEAMGSRIDVLLTEKEKQDYAAARSKAGIDASSYFISYLPGIFAGLLGGWYLLQGRITVGFLIGFIQITMGRISYAFPEFGGYLASSREAEVYAGRIMDYLTKADEPMIPAAREEAYADPLVEFSHVRFAYPGRPAVLSDVSFQVRPGQKVCFVGASGCGKSTILRLILGYYADQYEGSIRLFGRELREWNPGELREKLAPVFQDALLFLGTVRDNLAMLADEAQVAQVADRMNFSDEFLDRSVGDGGIMLSGGERQRVAVARGLLKEATLYLLDEPVANLDNVTQTQLLEELERVLAGRTQIVVEHRYEAVVSADLIYYLEGGRIAEQGRHEELLRLGGLYAQKAKQGGLDG